MLLGQAERSVEELAAASRMDFSNASAQLQVLSRARLVESRRHGKRVLYRLADENVGRFLVALREIARARLTEVEQVTRDYFSARDELEPDRLGGPAGPPPAPAGARHRRAAGRGVRSRPHPGRPVHPARRAHCPAARPSP